MFTKGPQVPVQHFKLNNTDMWLGYQKQVLSAPPAKTYVNSTLSKTIRPQTINNNWFSILLSHITTIKVQSSSECTFVHLSWVKKHVLMTEELIIRISDLSCNWPLKRNLTLHMTNTYMSVSAREIRMYDPSPGELPDTHLELHFSSLHRWQVQLSASRQHSHWTRPYRGLTNCHR